jgi:tetratricopeptide (TPR) repeat protein
LARAADADAPEESGPRADVAFAWGLKAFNHGDDKEAVARFEEAVRLDPDHGTAAYWLGLARLRMGDAKGAAQAIEKSLAAKRPPSTPKGIVLTSLGEAQLRSGDAAAAEKSLAQALADRPNDPNALYLHGLALARLGEAEKGRADAERALALEPTLPKVPSAAIAPGTGGELVGTGSLPVFEIRVEATGGHDSNPGVLSDDLTPIDPDTGLEADRSDNFATASVRAELHPFYGKGGWSLGLLLDAYRSFYQDLDALDLGFGDAAFQLAWGQDPLGFVTGPLGYTRVPTGNSTVSFLVQGGVGYSRLDDESYNRIQRLAGSATIREGKLTATQIDADYQDLNYFQAGSILLDPEVLNGHLLTFKASQYFFLGRRDRYIRAGFLRGEDSRSDEFFDSTITEGSLEASLPLGRWLVFYLAGSYREDDRDHGAAAHKEKTPAVTAAFIVPFAPHFYLTARGSWIDHDVQDIPVLDLLDYDRTVASLGVTWYH